MGAILATTADVVRRMAIAAQPFVPASAEKMLDLLGVPAEERLLAHALDPKSGSRRTAAAPSRVPQFELPKAAESRRTSGLVLRRPG